MQFGVSDDWYKDDGTTGKVSAERYFSIYVGDGTRCGNHLGNNRNMRTVVVAW